MELSSLWKSTIAAATVQLSKMALFRRLEKTTLVNLSAVFLIGNRGGIGDGAVGDGG